MSKHITFEADATKGAVKVTTSHTDHWGRQRTKREHTVSLYELERALRAASITIPWRELTAGRN